jgi:hypothetical protein
LISGQSGWCRDIGDDFRQNPMEVFYVSMDACGRDRDTDLRLFFSSAG